MRQIIALLLLSISLAGCDIIDTLKEGLKHSKAVEDDLKQFTGVRPVVGFHWQNGSLDLVTVTFPQVNDAKPLSEVAEEVRASVEKEFKQTPEKIELSFSIKPGAPIALPQANSSR